MGAEEQTQDLSVPVVELRCQSNLAGLTKNDYRGAPSTLCQGCGHNSISNQIVSALVRNEHRA